VASCEVDWLVGIDRCLNRGRAMTI
jgi:hypothetical protein